MHYAIKSPFTIWWEENMNQMAVSHEIRILLAKAFEGGRESIIKELNENRS